METEFLLDTHTFIYWHLDEKSLSKKVLKILEKLENNFFISSLSILEILSFDRPALIESIKLDSHRDPFDRIIVATAIAYKLKLLTRDRRILKSFPKVAVW